MYKDSKLVYLTIQSFLMLGNLTYLCCFCITMITSRPGVHEVDFSGVRDDKCNTVVGSSTVKPIKLTTCAEGSPRGFYSTQKLWNFKLGEEYVLWNPSSWPHVGKVHHDFKTNKGSQIVVDLYILPWKDHDNKKCKSQHVATWNFKTKVWTVGQRSFATNYKILPFWWCLVWQWWQHQSHLFSQLRWVHLQRWAMHRHWTEVRFHHIIYGDITQNIFKAHLI